jgi:lambda repressor-like predicted transcriptional regulator
MVTDLHKEDIMAGLRKRFGTVKAFEREHGLPAKSVHDLLRGRQSKRVAKAIEDALSKPLPPQDSEHSDDSPSDPAAHRLNSEAR